MPSKRQAGQWAAAALIAGLVALLYGVHGNAQNVEASGRSAIGWMVGRWGAGSNMSHGWLIPLVSAYALWRRRRELAAAPKHVDGRGLAVIAGALLLHAVGVRAQLTRVSLVSLVVLLWGLPFYFFGRETARQLVFPAGYLVFCIPLGFLSNLTVPLRLAASRLAAWLLNGIGIPTLRQGTMIRSLAGSGFNFDVADPCSGLRSLLAMTALTAAYAFFTQRGWWRRGLLFLSAVPVAIAGNVVRIVTVAVVAWGFGEERAVAVYHHFSGFLVFVVAVLLMVGVGELLREKSR
ncbi:MAG: exosortase/archaeosortase family protein [Lentisphaerae bacterium]|nr:exosortase/archaeosortase family protein [Lentisphaerota bacterium]